MHISERQRDPDLIINKSIDMNFRLEQDHRELEAVCVSWSRSRSLIDSATIASPVPGSRKLCSPVQVWYPPSSKAWRSGI